MTLIKSLIRPLSRPLTRSLIGGSFGGATPALKLFFNGSDQYMSAPTWTPTTTSFEFGAKVTLSDIQIGTVCDLIDDSGGTDGLYYDGTNIALKYTDATATERTITLSSLSVAADTEYTLKVSSDGSGVVLEEENSAESSSLSNVIDPTTLNLSTFMADQGAASNFTQGIIRDLFFTDLSDSSNSRFYAVNAQDSVQVDSLNPDGPDLWTYGDVVSTGSEGAFALISPIYNVLTSGKTYKYSFDVTGLTSGNLYVQPGGAPSTIGVSANGSYSGTVVAGSTQLRVTVGSVQCNAGTTVTNLIVQETTSAEIQNFNANMYNHTNGFWLEGDSFMDGAYTVDLAADIAADLTPKPVVTTAAGGTSETQIRDRIINPSNAAYLPRTLVLWDGGATPTDVGDYCDVLQTAFTALGHTRFVVINDCIQFGENYTGSFSESLAAEMQSRWPNNFINWYDHLTLDGDGLDESMYYDSGTDITHLSQAAMDIMRPVIIGRALSLDRADPPID